MTNEIADPVRKCLRALEAAQTDTEKFATLFLVPKCQNHGFFGSEISTEISFGHIFAI